MSYSVIHLSFMILLYHMERKNKVFYFYFFIFYLGEGDVLWRGVGGLCPACPVGGGEGGRGACAPSPLSPASPVRGGVIGYFHALTS